MIPAQINKGIGTKPIMRERERNFIICQCDDKYLEMNEIPMLVFLFKCTSLCCKQCQDTEITTKNEIFR